LKFIILLKLTLLITLVSLKLQAQSVSFALKTSPNIDFVFNTIEKYEQGIVMPSVLTLKVEAVSSEWDLYVGTTTITAGNFDLLNSYSTSGSAAIPVGILKARVYNTSNTSLTGTSFFNLTDIATPTYLIGSSSNDASANCGSTGTNVSGSYATQPQCYTFKVDLKATPGLTYRAGLYSLRVDFILVQDL